ncbi:MAG: hypothetical protein JNM83_01605 [Myxococcales bacterium]|nr:hypothetical protein [Myxococcales bacterium]
MAQDITNNIGGGGGYGGGGNGNPFAMQQNQQPQYAPASSGGFPAKIGGVQVMFYSEADALRAQMALQSASGNQAAAAGAPAGAPNWMNIAANAGSAINNLFLRSNLNRIIDDYQRALTVSNETRARLVQLQSKYPELIPVLLDAHDAERKATETAQSALESMVSANGIALGVDVVKIAGDFIQNGNGPASIFSGNSGSGTLLAGAAGLGVGLLAARSTTNSNNSR